VDKLGVSAENLNALFIFSSFVFFADALSVLKLCRRLCVVGRPTFAREVLFVFELRSLNFYLKCMNVNRNKI